MASTFEWFREFRDSRKIEALVAAIAGVQPGRLSIMEVCGGHTHVIMRYGLNQLLPAGIRFVHGPGCPVCIIPKERIDQAIALARSDDVVLVTLADMMRVPGSSSSLIRERAEGRDIRMVYSPLDVLKIAEDAPGKQVVYFAIGFETTAPLTAALVQTVLDSCTENVLIHMNHVLVPPALAAVMDDDDVAIDAFIAPGHVTAITGTGIYRELCERHRVPVVVSGFEPVDMLQSVRMIVEQNAAGRAEVAIQYTRAVRPEGNPKAQALVSKYFTVRDSFRWRGLGEIPASGLALRSDYARLDAEVRFADRLQVVPADDHRVCICGEILRGKQEPIDCPAFGQACTPANPVGACMVSSEGACHAYFTYQQVR